QSGGFNNVYMQPQADTENGVAVLLKKDALSSSGNDLWTSGGMYMALPYKISSGAVTISYDFKPIKYRRGGNNSQNNDELWETNFAMGVYTDIPSSTTAAVDANYFSVLQAVKKTQLGFAKKRISPEYDKWGTAAGSYWHTYEELDTDGFPWGLKEDVTIENPKWYSIEIKLNFDKNTVEYYVDGEKQAESNTLMNEIGTYSSGTLTNPVSDGIVGIGFGIGTQPLYTEQMIDNIRVTRSLPELGDPVDDFSGDFSDYTGSAQYSAPSGWTNSYQWQAGGFNNVYLQPQADTVSGTAVLLKKDALSSTGNDLWTSGGMYMALPSRISSGTVSIGYDFKPIKYKRGGDLTNDKVWETNFAVGVYADLPSETTAAVSGDYLSVLQAVKKTQLGFAKKRISPESDNWTDSGSGSYWYTSCELDTDGSPWDMGEVLAIADPKWYRIELVLDFDQKMVEYYVDGEKQGESSTLMDEIGTYSSGALANPISNGIVGVGIGIGTTARYSEQLIDNITVSHRGIKAAGGVSAVRFSDCTGDMYGASPSLTTLTDTIAVSFWNTPDADSVNTSTVKLLKNGTEVSYTGSVDADAGAYVMNLDNLLDRNSDYVLKVDGVTVGGVAVTPYEQQIHTDENGSFIAEPIRIYLNGTEAQSGTIVEGNKIKADVSLIDTTGDEKNYNFSMVLYNGDTLSKVDFIDFSMGGTDNTKLKTAECEFTIDAQDVQNLTQIKAFLWSGMDKLTPIMIPAEFTMTR
ncbi:MAG: hypothetical protein Q4E94_02010, partial [Clostridia bacterium]|nr:hypothetical protein [Clostridia bacterium]